MVALPPSDWSLYLSSAMALVLLGCGVEARPAAMGEVEADAGPILAERVYVANPPGDVGASVDPSSDGAALTPPPVHRYGFDGQGTIVRDSIGGADGSVVEAALAGDGLLRLQGGAGYVELPGGLLSQHQSATLEFWLAWEGDSNRRYERIFDFGSSTVEAEGVRIDSDFFLSPSYDDAKPRLQFRDQSGDESQLFGWRVFPARRTTHVVVVLDGLSRSMAFYIDGESLGSTPWNQALNQLGDENVWLGRSQQRTDPHLAATFDEFRIYDRILSSEQIEANFGNGPDGVAPSDAPAQAGGAQVPLQ
jgi:hypothetical protein